MKFGFGIDLVIGWKVFGSNPLAAASGLQPTPTWRLGMNCHGKTDILDCRFGCFVHGLFDFLIRDLKCQDRSRSFFGVVGLMAQSSQIFCNLKL